MRTTLTIEDALLRTLKEMAHRSGKPLKDTVNAALRAGIEQMSSPPPRRRYRCKTFSLGSPEQVNFDKALDLAAALEDEEICRKLTLRK
ncbi:MAG: DUF2191 domain-containing protein [Thermodesulfobacteriota bacterium]